MTDTCRFVVLVLFFTFLIRRPTFLATSRQDPTRRHGQAGKFCHAICLEESNKLFFFFGVYVVTAGPPDGSCLREQMGLAYV